MTMTNPTLPALVAVADTVRPRDPLWPKDAHELCTAAGHASYLLMIVQLGDFGLINVERCEDILRELKQTTGVSAQSVLRDLGLPGDLAVNEVLSPLAVSTE